MMLPILAAATTVAGWSIVSSQENEERSVAQCLKKSDAMLAQEVENKFATYWPRNIMILFGPPGKYKTMHNFNFYLYLYVFIEYHLYSY